MSKISENRENTFPQPLAPTLDAMMANPHGAKVPAAEYLRMSTDKQEYSIANQIAKIRDYAVKHNMELTATYTDEATSGLTVAHRLGLKRLLHDVLNKPEFKVILVYDISRWGRFQDLDEAGHYEFVCRRAGVPIHYCADDLCDAHTVADALVKTVKRVMAAEYSQQLSERVFEGQRRLAGWGFSMGGKPPYGLRRVLVDREGRAKQLLEPGERKSIATDRILLTLGPDEEVMSVRRIFDLVRTCGNNPKAIADELNCAGFRYRGELWKGNCVLRIISHPGYAGVLVWGRKTKRLRSPVKSVPRNDWVIAPGKFPPIIDQAAFDRVPSPRWSDQRILDFLSGLLQEQGNVTLQAITSNNGPCYHTIKRHFGSIKGALELIGLPYIFPRKDRLHGPRRHLASRMTQELCSMFPDHMQVFSGGPYSKARLLVDGKFKVDILLVARNFKSSTIAWSRKLSSLPQPEFVLFCLMGLSDTEIAKMYLKKWRAGAKAIHIAEGSSWFKHAIKVPALEEFYGCLLQAAAGAANSRVVDELAPWESSHA